MAEKLHLNLRNPVTGEALLPPGRKLAGYILDQLDVVALWQDLAQSPDEEVRFKTLRFLHEARFGRAQASPPPEQEVKEIQVTVKHVGQPRQLVELPALGTSIKETNFLEAEIDATPGGIAGRGVEEEERP